MLGSTVGSTSFAKEYPVHKFEDFVEQLEINDATRYAQLLQERRKTAMTHTQSFVGEGFGEKYSLENI